MIDKESSDGYKEMKTKALTFLLSLTFLFLFSGSSVVFGDELQGGMIIHKTNLKESIHYTEEGYNEIY